MLVENMSVPADRRVWAEARALVALGYDVTVICPRGNGRDESELEIVEGVAIHRFALDTAGGGPWSYLREYGSALRATRRLAVTIDRQRAVDVVHVCNPPDILFVSVRRLLRRGARMVFDHHDLVPELYEARFGRSAGVLRTAATLFERLTFRSADVVISPNESYRRVAVERGRLRPADVFVVRIAPDLERFRPVEPEAAAGDDRRQLIAYAGTIGPQDGVDHALRALRVLATLRDDWRAVIAGSGDWRNAALALSRELGIEDRVTLPGHLTDDELIPLLSSAAVCLSPEPKNAFNDASTMIKVVEYMALAKPIVAYDLTETRYSAGDAALYAAPSDPTQLAACIERLLDDPALRARMGESGRRRIETELNWERSVASLEQAYRRVFER